MVHILQYLRWFRLYFLRPGYRPTWYGKYTYESDLAGYLYTPILDDQLLGTPWQYSQLAAFYQSDPCPGQYPYYLNAYLKYPFLEYLVKLRLYRLADEVAFAGSSYFVDKICDIAGNDCGTGTPRPHSGYPSAGSGQSEFFTAAAGSGNGREYGRIHIPLIEWSGRHEISREENILAPLHYMTPEALMKYAEAQYSNYSKKSTCYARRYSVMNSVLDDYRDYLSMSEALKLDMSSSFILYPKRPENRP